MICLNHFINEKRRRKIFDAKVGTKEYAIPEGEFESVIQTFLPVDIQILRMEEGYDTENGYYKYRQRGQYDIGGNPDTPYPESKWNVNRKWGRYSDTNSRCSVEKEKIQTGHLRIKYRYILRQTEPFYICQTRSSRPVKTRFQIMSETVR